ncbi:MAG: hypothetical protein ACRCU6_05510 [Fusobacteriaceae bacterium]
MNSKVFDFVMWKLSEEIKDPKTLIINVEKLGKFYLVRNKVDKKIASNRKKLRNRHKRPLAIVKWANAQVERLKKEIEDCLKYQDWCYSYTGKFGKPEKQKDDIYKYDPKINIPKKEVPETSRFQLD